MKKKTKAGEMPTLKYCNITLFLAPLIAKIRNKSAYMQPFPPFHSSLTLTHSRITFPSSINPWKLVLLPLLMMLLMPSSFHSHEDPLVSRMDHLLQMLSLLLRAVGTLVLHSLQCSLLETLWSPPLLLQTDFRLLISPPWTQRVPA